MIEKRPVSVATIWLTEPYSVRGGGLAGNVIDLRKVSLTFPQVRFFDDIPILGDLYYRGITESKGSILCSK